MRTRSAASRSPVQPRRRSDLAGDREDADGIFFGLADLGFGCPELGSFALAELEAARLPFGLSIERDLHFTASHPLSAYAEAARQAGSIIMGEHRLRRAASRLSGRG